MDDAVADIAQQPMEGEPGKTFHYSNAGLQLAAAVIEKISGQDFKTLFQERIADPLQMTQTDWGKGAVPLAAGGAWSTATDYAQFLMMLLADGQYNGKQILSHESILAMQQNRVTEDVVIAYTPAEAAGWGYGFGEWTPEKTNPGERARIVTSPGLFGSFPWINNEKQYGGFLFTVNLKQKGRKDRDLDLIKTVESVLSQ